MLKQTLITGVAALALFASAQLFAEDVAPAQPASTTTVQGANFVDNDGDGICDNYATRQGKGQGKGAGAGKGQGKGFVDANKDGVCDNYGTGTGKGAGKGCGGGGKCGQGKGKAGK